MAIPLTATGSPEVEVNKNAERASLIQGGLNLFRVYGIDHSFVSKVYNRILRGRSIRTKGSETAAFASRSEGGLI
jgi:hypothetical protein